MQHTRRAQALRRVKFAIVTEVSSIFGTMH
jgi:hypothetical protein